MRYARDVCEYDASRGTAKPARKVNKRQHIAVLSAIVFATAWICEIGTNRRAGDA
jgi:hypothetical protein